MKIQSWTKWLVFTPQCQNKTRELAPGFPGRWLTGLVFGLVLIAVRAEVRAADETWLYAVEINAVVQAAPPMISLAWDGDPYGVDSFELCRKHRDESVWSAITTNLPGGTLAYTDTNVVVGETYEYKVVKHASLGYTGYGYIYSGIEAPFLESRGKVLLIVATNATAPLSDELARLQADLVGDGWAVQRHEVSSNDTPVYVRNLITNAYYADPTNVSCVFLFGHVPVLHSGTNLNYDGHLARAMPADAFYGEMRNDWPTNPADSPGFLPSDVALMVGRVDLFGMPGNGAPTPWPDETELLRRYLDKDHNWRQGRLQVNHLALMGNLRGDEDGEATATSGYRNFAPMVGRGRTVEANVDPAAPPEERWISYLARTNYLWAYGCGAGQPTALSGLGTNDGTFYDVWSTDVVGVDAKAVFVLLFGSWFGNWDYGDDLLRSVLATPTMGLAACMAGRPHWFFHHMALGEPIGYSTRLSMNNSDLYQNQSNRFTRAVYVGLMGDPTLRLDPVKPPTNLVAQAGSNAVNLRWDASPDTVLGYHVFRALDPGGPFTRLSQALVTRTNFTDVSPAAATAYTYMVRAVKLETTPSGSYFNGSEGVFATASNLPPRLFLMLSARASGTNQFTLGWNAASGVVYHLETSTNLFPGSWSRLSPNLQATSAETIWTDTSAASASSRFYRLSSP